MKAREGDSRTSGVTLIRYTPLHPKSRTRALRGKLQVTATYTIGMGHVACHVGLDTGGAAVE